MHRNPMIAASRWAVWLLWSLVMLGSEVCAEPRRVLIIHSFGQEFAPFDTMSSTFRTELARQSSEPLEFYESSIETARFTAIGNDGPLLAYLQTLFAHRRLDLIVTIAEPATHFAIRHRASFFPHIPLLAHVDHRQSDLVLATTNATIVPVHVRIPVIVENILEVLPRTTNVMMVLGASPFEQYWNDLCRREFAPFTNRIQFTYVSELPLEQIGARAGELPPNSAVLYGMLAVDGAGVPYEQERALKSLHRMANAPLFGTFESQLGHGIVGGRLISLETSGRQAADIALRLLRGEPPQTIRLHSPDSLKLAYDWRELRRWNIDLDRLPPDSDVRYRMPTFWEEYKWQLIGIHALCLVEGILIFALLRGRRRLRRTQSKLRQSEARLSLATNSVKVGVWSWNLQSNAIDATPECKAMFGFAAEQSVNFTQFLERVHPDDRPAVQRAVMEAMEHKSVYDTQYRIVLPSGTIRWIAARGRGQYSDESAREMLGVVLDITERKQAEAETQRHRQELAHVSRVSIMGELSASMAHELNQPLTAILTNAQAAQRFMATGDPDLNEFREILKDIADDTTRARDVIRHLRALVKKSEPDFTQLDIGETTREVIGFLHGDIVARNVRVVSELAPQLPLIYGDRTQLQQVIINLLLNAFDALNGNPVSERLVVVTAVQDSPQSVRVSVRDRGVGIPPDKLNIIFDPFYTTKSEGMGMGLSVTRSIIESHQGRIWAENCPEQGAILCFTLPVAKPT
jgi:PAS domain S-box-containing protein